MEQSGILGLRIIFFGGAIMAIILSLLLRITADNNYRLGNKPVARFETFLAFALVVSALLSCFMLYYIDKVIPS